MNVQKPKALRTEPLQTPSYLKSEGVGEIAGALNILLADVLAVLALTDMARYSKSSSPGRRRRRLTRKRDGRLQ